MIPNFIQKNWIEYLQSISIIISLVITFIKLRNDSNTQKVKNLFEATKSHRDIWSKIYDNPKLNRIRESNINLRKAPPTIQERRMIGFIINHLFAIYEARKLGQLSFYEIETKDIYQFFNKPIPKLVWAELKEYQNSDFVTYIDSILIKTDKW